MRPVPIRAPSRREDEDLAADVVEQLVERTRIEPEARGRTFTTA